MYFGFSVNRAISDIQTTYRESTGPRWRRVPFEKWTDLLAAYMNRQFLMTLVIGLAATVPAILTIWLMQQQNEKIDKQIYLSQQGMASQFSGQIAELLTAISRQAGTECIDLNALKKNTPDADQLMGIGYASCWNDLTGWGRSQATRFRWLAARAQMAGDTQAQEQFLGHAQYAADVEEGKIALSEESTLSYGATIPASAEVIGRAHAVTNALSPYRLIVEPLPGQAVEGSPALTDQSYSPERGLILKQFLLNGIDFRGNYRQSLVERLHLFRAYAGALDLPDALIRCSSFDETNLKLSNFKGANMQGVSFGKSDLRFTEWEKANLDNVVFRESALPNASRFRGARLDKITFKDAIVTSASWAAEMAEQTIEFSADSVTVAPAPKGKAFLVNSVDDSTMVLNRPSWVDNCSGAGNRSIFAR